MPQSFVANYIHLVFSTKNRISALKGTVIQNELFPYINQVIKKNHSTCFIINGTENHIHLFISLSPRVALSDLVRNIKRASSIWLKEKDAQFKEFHWQEGYAAYSVSHSLMTQVSSYIENQEKHHKMKSFEEEFVEFLKMQRMHYDEKYLFG